MLTPPPQYTTTANATIATNNTANSTKQHRHSLYSQSTAPKAFKTTRPSSLRSNTRSLHVEMMHNKIKYNSPANSSTKRMEKNEKHDSKRNTTTKKFLPRQSTNNTIKYGNNTINDKNNEKTNVLMKPTSLERCCTKIILLLVAVKTW
jgi:hypothetical protein